MFRHSRSLNVLLLGPEPKSQQSKPRYISDELIHTVRVP